MKAVDGWGTITSGVRALFIGAPFLLSALPLFALFVLVPNTKVKWRYALITALGTSVLFELAKGGFNYYVVHILPVNKVYGSLGLLPVFLLWIYFSWFLILIGVVITFTIQNLRSLHLEAQLEHSSTPLSTPVHEEWGVIILRTLFELFSKKGGPISAADISDTVDLLPPQIEDHLSVLGHMGIITEIEVGDQSGYLPSVRVDGVTQKTVENIFRAYLGLPTMKEGPDDDLLLS
jgi:membrane protein